MNKYYYDKDEDFNLNPNKPYYIAMSTDKDFIKNVDVIWYESKSERDLKYNELIYDSCNGLYKDEY